MGLLHWYGGVVVKSPWVGCLGVFHLVRTSACFWHMSSSGLKTSWKIFLSCELRLQRVVSHYLTFMGSIIMYSHPLFSTQGLELCGEAPLVVLTFTECCGEHEAQGTPEPSPGYTLYWPCFAQQTNGKTWFHFIYRGAHSERVQKCPMADKLGIPQATVCDCA